ncbi:MAG: shikimate dehydrogenase [Chloroflexota bacterium]|nr:shikimate dehydrogenase [Chloroflexota bacterium]
MRRLGVIGYPIKHSISPAFQQAALDALGIAARYERYEVSPQDLSSFLGGVRGGEWMGVNVTIPHKQAVMSLLDEVEPLAAAIGSVNSVVRRDSGDLWGCSTDVSGFVSALEETGYSVEDSRAVVLGTGGTARAVLAALLQNGAASVTVLGRSLERGQELLECMAQLPFDTAGTTLDTTRWDLDDPAFNPESLTDLLWNSNLLVNTTPFGMVGGPEEGESPLPTFLLHPNLTVFDAVYNPIQTPLLERARARRARVVSGLEMLVYQGAASFKLWTGEDAPIDVMKKAAREALEGYR